MLPNLQQARRMTRHLQACFTADISKGRSLKTTWMARGPNAAGLKDARHWYMVRRMSPMPFIHGVELITSPKPLPEGDRLSFYVWFRCPRLGVPCRPRNGQVGKPWSVLTPFRNSHRGSHRDFVHLKLTRWLEPLLSHSISSQAIL